MSLAAKTVSVSQLQAAVKSALEKTQAAHPALKAHNLTAANELPLLVRFPWIAGIPPFPFEVAELTAIVEATARFAANLADEKQIAPIGRDGKFTPALQVSGNTIAIGFVPAEVSFSK